MEKNQIVKLIKENLKKDQLRSLHLSHVQSLQASYNDLMEDLKVDAVWISAGKLNLKYSLDDMHWPFVATPSFLHWLPLARPGDILCVGIDTRQVMRSDVSSFWDSVPPDRGFYARDAFEWSSYKLIEELKKKRPIRSFWIGDDSEAALRIGFLPEQINNREFIDRLHEIRTRKSYYELFCIAEATKIAVRGHRHLRQLFAERFLSEFELFLEYLKVTQQTVYETAYDPIVAMGSHAGTLHHIEYDKNSSPERDLSLLLDAGATFQGYRSDITRTYVKGDHPSSLAFKELIKGVEGIQQEICNDVKPGELFEDLHNQTHLRIASLMRAIGLATAPQDCLVDKGITRTFLPHGLGHSIGLQVHDVGMRIKIPSLQNPYLRNTSRVEVGQVVTVEPGFYFIPSLLEKLKASPEASCINWSMVDELLKYGGVRIEDNLLITAMGSLNLTREIFVD